MQILNKSNPWENEYLQTQQAPIYEQLWEILQNFFKEVHGKSVLDYGCGDGNYSKLIHTMGFNVTGIDASSNAIKIAQSSCNSEGVSFHLSDSVPESFPSNSFDVVVMLNILHCISNGKRKKIIEQARRVLKNKGHFFASVLSIDDESYPRDTWAKIDPSTFEDDSGKLFHFFTLKEIMSELEGLKILNTSILENVHPDVGKKSSLHIIVGQNKK